MPEQHLDRSRVYARLREFTRISVAQRVRMDAPAHARVAAEQRDRAANLRRGDWLARRSRQHPTIGRRLPTSSRRKVEPAFQHRRPLRVQADVARAPAFTLADVQAQAPVFEEFEILKMQDVMGSSWCCLHVDELYHCFSLASSHGRLQVSSSSCVCRSAAFYNSGGDVG